MANQFENFLKRNNDETKTREMPRDLFQAVVFYFRPVCEELKFENEEVAQKLLKESLFLNKGKIKFSLEHIREFSEKLLEGQKFVFPFYSEDIFMSPKEVELYIPRFVKKLIGENKIPEDAIKENTINYEVIETGIVPLNFATMEKSDEFKITM
jgi:hypothetical protein